MNSPTVFISAVALVLLSNGSLRVSSSTSPPKDPFLGIAPEDVKYYSSSNRIKCKDGSKKFTRALVNDDFCDCPNGTDEPDCCDGSDEYGDKVKCLNTCQEAGKAV
ncbi:hypothetical protein ACJRO7_028225 [Eucalyptus globulus]|uniref:Uncharacterized protein n=1 Tax=Eucalyptus globulus TaxID=34317 RepID=A0ABD3JTT9_EUCGL